MKKIKQLGFALTMVLTLVLSSCSSDSDSNSGGGSGPAGLGTLRATIGGSSFSSISQASMAMLASNGAFQNLSISGADLTGRTLQIMILGENIGVGTYAISETSEMPSTAVYSEVDISNPSAGAQSWGAPYDGGGNSGSVVITSMTATNVQGTFSFTALNVTGSSGTKAVTNGAFNINITAN